MLSGRGKEAKPVARSLQHTHILNVLAPTKLGELHDIPSPVNYRDFDVVLFSMGALANASDKARPDYTIREVVAPALAKLKSVLDAGRLVIVWLLPPSFIAAHPEFNAEFHALLRSVPLPVDCIFSVGPKIIPQAPYFQDFLSQSATSFRYVVAYEAEAHIPAFLRDADEHACIGSAYVTASGGVLLCLPDCSNFGEPMIAAALDLADTLRAEYGAVKALLPDWAKLMLTPAEADLNAKIIQIDAQIAGLSLEVATRRTEFSKLEERKLLFYGPRAFSRYTGSRGA